MKFECQESCGGKCCVSPDKNGFVFLTNFDLMRLEKFLGVQWNKFASLRQFDYTRFNSEPSSQFFLKNSVGKSCRFLKNGKCLVYEARPTQCRTFPFWPELMNAKEWKKLSKICPGVGKGKKLSQEFVEGKINEQREADADANKQ